MTKPRPAGDDHLTKPFAMVELSARVEAMLRRFDNVRTTKLYVGDLETATKEAFCGMVGIHFGVPAAPMFSGALVRW